jgi:serine/threonine protein kinase
LPSLGALLDARARHHRDLKSDNILLSRGSLGNELEPKVLDFGIAKFEQSLSSNSAGAGDDPR